MIIFKLAVLAIALYLYYLIARAVGHYIDVWASRRAIKSVMKSCGADVHFVHKHSAPRFLCHAVVMTMCLHALRVGRWLSSSRNVRAKNADAGDGNE